MQIEDVFIAVGSTTKRAYLNCLEEQQAWSDLYNKPVPSIVQTKRYFILSTEEFLSKEDALSWLNAQDFSILKYRSNTAGALILPAQTFLFFTLPNKR